MAADSVLSAFSPQDDILCDTAELQKELQCLRQESEKALQQRISVQHARLDLAEVMRV